DLYSSNFPSSFTLFGAAFGPTPIILSVTGANLIFDDGRALNSTWTYIPDGYTGFGSDNGAGLLANGGKLRVTGAPKTLFAAPTISQASLNIRREMAPG